MLTTGNSACQNAKSPEGTRSVYPKDMSVNQNCIQRNWPSWALQATATTTVGTKTQPHESEETTFTFQPYNRSMCKDAAAGAKGTTCWMRKAITIKCHPYHISIRKGHRWSFWHICWQGSPHAGTSTAMGFAVQNHTGWGLILSTPECAQRGTVPAKMTHRRRACAQSFHRTRSNKKHASGND